MKKESLEINNLGSEQSLPEHFNKNFISKYETSEKTSQKENSMPLEEKVLDIKYHNQINNEVLPYSTCGTTVLAEYIEFLNKKNSKNYECNDDQVFLILNSDDMIAVAKKLIKEGKLDSSALTPRQDKVNTKVDESKFLHLNNFSDMLAEVGKYISNNEYQFKTSYMNSDEIKAKIDSGYPVIISGKFTSGGHFVIIIGYDNDGNYVIDDPYGSYSDKYEYSTLGKGNKMKYKVDKVMEIATIKDNSGKAKVLSI